MEKGSHNMNDLIYYVPPSPAHWQGRIDGSDPTHLRWHQHVELFNLTSTKQALAGKTVLLGFACDEGVRRNKGRLGAHKGPEYLRKALANLPVHTAGKGLVDVGDISCPDRNLEHAQVQLAHAVQTILQAGGFPILLGGGHEITYGHYCGIRHSKDGAIGTVNFDAHFDNREPDSSGPSSGTGFWQIAEDYKLNYEGFGYLAIGIQQASNTRALFDTAKRTGTSYVLAGDFHAGNAHQIHDVIDNFVQCHQHIYVTLDMDVFAAAYAPGVSAPAYNGILPDHTFFNCLNRIMESGKMVSIDITELNPDLDIDNRTARLAAAIIHHIVEWMSTSPNR